MSHPIPAIVESAVDLKSIERQVQKAKIALDDADRLVDATGKSHESAVEQQRRARVEIGRQLVEAKRGCRHGEWLPLLERCGIDKSTAARWMQLAGFVETKLLTDSDVSNLPAPTLRDAGIDKRPRKSELEREEQPDPVTDWTREVESRRAQPEAPSLDIDRELSRIHDKVCSFAESIPTQYRKRIVHQLRETARLIEGME